MPKDYTEAYFAPTYMMIIDSNMKVIDYYVNEDVSSPEQIEDLKNSTRNAIHKAK